MIPGLSLMIILIGDLHEVRLKREPESLVRKSPIYPGRDEMTGSENHDSIKSRRTATAALY